MVRAVVHKTQGKLDLRSLTVFGLNAKPTTDTPIGYFGTGLKYAVAVLARNNIPITFWIDSKKWTIEQDDTKFRDKSFKALTLKRNTLIPKSINLPFTTELGKNWKIWQAFRELESNTRDEKGESFQMHNAEGEPTDVLKMVGKGYTTIVVEGEEYVQCHLDKDKYFLPDGLTQQDIGNMNIQVFPRKSNAVYYRSIKVLDLKEPSENTYNILTKLELTEDRTVSEFNANWVIQQFLAHSKNSEVIRRAVTAPPKSLERKFDYEYFSRGETFLNEVTNAGEDATDYAKSILKRDRPPERPVDTYANWIRDLIAAVSRGDFDRVKEVIDEHRNEIHLILSVAAETMEKEDVNNNSQTLEVPRGSDRKGVADVTVTNSSAKAASAQDDDIPF